MKKTKRKKGEDPGRSILSLARQGDDTLIFTFEGDCRLGQFFSSAEEIRDALEAEPRIRRVEFDTNALQDWDSSLLTFLVNVKKQCDEKKIRVNADGLPPGVKRLVALATAVPEITDTGKGGARKPFFTQVGEDAVVFFRAAGEMLAFIGEAFTVFLKFLVGKANFRRSDLFLQIQEAGAQALPIVSLISLLVGLILAFVGAVQLSLFGAQIYVADLVGISMVRVMGAIMTGIVMAGRTGASYAAQLGTMQVNEELDALTTLGVSPMEFLVLPRMLALTIMMPLLCLYADLMGILGGMIVGVFMLDINVLQYYAQTKAAIGLTQVWIGLFHSLVFGVLVSLAGCLRGIQCGRSASAVGQATTSAVVTGIVSIIVVTAIITFICNVLGI